MHAHSLPLYFTCFYGILFEQRANSSSLFEINFCDGITKTIMFCNTYIKFNRTINEIPDCAIGFIQNNNYNRVFIPRYYTGLDKNLLPCYDLGKNEFYTQICETMLTDIEKQMLNELEIEIDKKENLYIGPNGILIKTLWKTLND